MDVDDQVRLNDPPLSKANLDIQDALMGSDNIKKGKTKTPSTGKSQTEISLNHVCRSWKSRQRVNQK